MLTTVRGIVKGNTVIIQDKISPTFEGYNAIITFLENSKNKTYEKPDWDSFVIPSERGQNVEQYMAEMRNNDRL